MKNALFGRKQYLEILEKRIRGLKYGYRQNIAIIGDELTGKTSLVFQFLKDYQDNYTLILYLEVRPESQSAFFKRFIGTLLYNFLINSNIRLKEDLDFLVNKASGYIPKTTEKIKFILGALEKKKKFNLFAELLSLPETIHQETGKFCVVIFDEFHHLESIGIKNLYAEWSRLLILQKNTMYVIISSMKFKAKLILAKNLSLLFGNFETINIEPFDIKTSEQYLEDKLDELKLDRGLKNFIVYFSAGHPFYLKVISEAILKSADLDLGDTLENLLFDTQGILNQRFSSYLKCFLGSGHSQDYISILYLIANGQNKVKEIPHLLNIPRKEFSLRINQLLELDVIARNNDFLQINDRVFSFWIRFVYQGKLQSLTFDAKNQQALFRNKISQIIEDFLLAGQRPITERITELLRLFEGERIQIEKKRLRLNQFREIKPLEFNYRPLKEGLIGRSEAALWIIAFKHEQLTEEDIMEFARECKKYRNKTQRKIIIAFKDIETNARLRAMEERIMTWDLNRLNYILGLFSKPGVMV